MGLWSTIGKCALAAAAATGVGAVCRPLAFRWACDRAFDRIDTDGSGDLDDLEIHLALYEMFNSLNKRLPGWDDPPSRAEVAEAIKKVDKDENGRLDRKEFLEFCRQFNAYGPGRFFKRVGGSCTAEVGVYPAAAKATKEAIGYMGGLSESVLAGGIKAVHSFTKSVIPP